jgi:hypothetical protein
MATGQTATASIWAEPVAAHSVAPTRIDCCAKRAVALALVAGSSAVALLALGALVAVTLTAPWDYTRIVPLVLATFTFGAIAGIVLFARELARALRRSGASSDRVSPSAAPGSIELRPRDRWLEPRRSPLGAHHHILPPRASVYVCFIILPVGDYFVAHSVFRGEDGC